MPAPKAAPWDNPGWTKGVHAWIETQLQSLGHRLLGTPDQFYIRPWSTVYKVPSSIGNLYFKATLPGLAQEAALTHFLALHWPNLIPRILAIDHQLGWLLMEDGGVKLRELMGTEAGLRHWARVLPAYAGLQVEVSDHCGNLLSLGVPDRRLAALPGLFAELMAGANLEEYQRQGLLEPGQARRLREGGKYLSDICSAVSAYGLPETLDHGDFHDGNIFYRGGRHVFFDWGDASLTHPFFSLRTVAVSLGYRPGLAPDAPRHLQLRARYLERWRRYGSEGKLEECAALAQRIAPIVSALRWHQALAHLEAPGRSEYGHAIPSLLQEYLAENDLFY